MVLERAFSRKMEKTCLERATLNSFPWQTAAPDAILALEVVPQSSVFVDNIVSSNTHRDTCRCVRCRQVSTLPRVRILTAPCPDLHECIRSLYFYYNRDGKEKIK